MEKYLDLPGLKVEILSYKPSKSEVKKSATDKKRKTAKRRNNQRLPFANKKSIKHIKSNYIAEKQ
jgi:hypothetical protein